MISDEGIKRAQAAYIEARGHPISDDSIRLIVEAALPPDADVAGVVERLHAARMTFDWGLCRFRWVVPSFSAYAFQAQCKRLQQAFNTPEGRLVWRDVPMVEEKADG